MLRERPSNGVTKDSICQLGYTMDRQGRKMTNWGPDEISHGTYGYIAETLGACCYLMDLTHHLKGLFLSFQKTKTI